MREKSTNLIYGSLLALALSSPPQFINIAFLDFSEFSIILLTFLILLSVLQRYSLKEIYDFFILSYWFYVTLFFSLSFFIYGINNLTLRFLFYSFFGFVMYLYLKSTSFQNIEYLFLPLWSITFLNLVTFILELSFLNNTLGWISFFYEDPTFFNRGRLSGYQGGGPNVAGLLFIFLVFMSFYLYVKTKKMYYLIISFINLFLLILTSSRGSYLAFTLSIIGYFVFYKKLSKNKIIFSTLFTVISTLLFLNLTNPQLLLKESDRAYLTNIALNNVALVEGFGGGNYINEIYGRYFLSINPEILEKNLNIKLNKVELGITPEEFRDTEVNFFIGTSGGGYELLQQANIADQCSEDRITCQHVRVDENVLIKFLSSIFDQQLDVTRDILMNSSCINSSNALKTRGEFYCLTEEIISKQLNKNSNIEFSQNDLFVECEETKTYLCENRQLAIGELAVLVEKLVYSKSFISEENFKKFCVECEFRNVEGFIKIDFDKRDGILPRSKFTFSTSADGVSWEPVGFSRTKGNLVNFNVNKSFIEIGGHSDGQSFGNTFLDGTVKSLTITSKNISNEIIFNQDYQNNQFYVFKPNSIDPYTSKITYESDGIKLFRPNKYWVAIENNFDFNEDFEIVLQVSLPEIPWQTHTLISNTSIFNNQIQSWRVDIDDGRLFFSWTDQNGVFVQDNVIGDKSLRSGILVQRNGKISNAESPIVDPSFLSQLTTAHNGYLTFAVEYGLILSILIFSTIFRFVLSLFQNIDDQSMILFLCLVAFFVQNFTNDMIYSADIFILFNFLFSMIAYLTNSFSDKKV